MPIRLCCVHLVLFVLSVLSMLFVLCLVSMPRVVCWTRGARTFSQRFSRINSLEDTYPDCREFAEESLQTFCGMLYAKIEGLAAEVSSRQDFSDCET
jgi:hypothetical protein